MTSERKVLLQAVAHARTRPPSTLRSPHSAGTQEPACGVAGPYITNLRSGVRERTQIAAAVAARVAIDNGSENVTVP